eukprot:scaffold10085_cov95-Alexandrium_tamarense.AAC.1
MLCDVVHEGSVKTTLSALRSLKKGHGLASLMKTIAKNNTLTDITNETSLGGLKMSEEERALLHQHDETKSIASILAIKGGNKLSSLMKTIAKNNTLSDITNATSLGGLKMSEEDRALLHQHDETKSIASILANKLGKQSGYCGETKFFKEGSRVRGTCRESCYSRDYGFSKHYHSEWKVTKPSQKEMNELNEYRARK